MPDVHAPFEFATAGQIVFGPGRFRELPDLAARLGRRVFLVTGKASRFAGTVDAAARCAIGGEPSFDDVRRGVAQAREASCDVVVAIGGGSAIDAGKAIAMLLTNGGDPLDYAEVIGAGCAVARASAPFVAVPTTAGTGSEATRNAVLTSIEQRAKVSLRSPFMLPRVALVDPELTRDLPRSVTAATGMDALAQLIEPFLSRRANPMTDALCREGMVRVARALPAACEDGQNLAARSDLAMGALWSGMALANAGLGAVHGLAAAIGGAFDAPHGAICAALLPGVFEANARAVRDRTRFDEVAQRMVGRADARAADGVAWLADLRDRLGIPRLAAYGLRAEHVAALVQSAGTTSSMKGNPVDLSREELEGALVAAL